MKQRIVIADDHELLIQGLKTIVDDIENVELAATLNNGNDLLGYLDKHRVDLVMLDLNMPGYDGLRCLKIIKQLYPLTKVMVLTSYNQPELVNEVRAMNAEGFLIKNTSSTELKEAITAILAGEKHYPTLKELQPAMDTGYYFDDFLKKFQLTKREVDIIRHVCTGMSSKQVASALHLSEFTVNTHRKNILRKLNVGNVAGLVNFAREHQLI
ncbi:MAG: response regulator containing a CheY-like receiver domain and an DNA-binding domain [Chitinophagaceae bacterium]|jgi:DNA-binding NarL/FixJ family response regulator|nr:response regulator containing a CheY-like receiver domain and an DNA-binding domain [Chitinophagaceae bacterium]